MLTLIFQENAGLLAMQRPMKEKVGLKQVNIKTVKFPSAVMSSLHDGLLIIA